MERVLEYKKNIAVIFNMLFGGGAERIAGLLSKYLSDRYNVFLFLVKTDGIMYEYAGTIVDIGFRGLDYLEYSINEAKIKYEIDVSISFMEMFNFMNIRTKTNDLVIISERDYTEVLPEVGNYNDWMKKELYGKADYIVAISNGIENNLLKFSDVSPHRISTIYNFCDIEKIRANSELELRIIEDGFFEKYHVIVSIGRLAEEKNHRRLLYQFKRVFECDQLSRLLIIGSGECKEEIENLIERLNLGDYVTLMPYCQNPFYYLRKADVFAFSSKSEGYGNVILEAMAVGTPVVAVDCVAGPREILDDNSNYNEQLPKWKICKKGILTSRAETEDSGKTTYFAEAILYLLNNPTKANEIVLEATHWINNRSNNKLADEWGRIIEQVTSNKSSWFFDNTSCRKHYIYGAGNFAEKLFLQLQEEGVSVDGFIVTKKHSNKMAKCGLNVIEFNDIVEKRDEIDVFIGTSNIIFQNEIIKKLIDAGIMILDNPVVKPIIKL